MIAGLASALPPLCVAAADPTLPAPSCAAPAARVSSRPRQCGRRHSDPSLPPVKTKTNWRTKWAGHIRQGTSSVATFCLPLCSWGFAFRWAWCPRSGWELSAALPPEAPGTSRNSLSDGNGFKATEVLWGKLHPCHQPAPTFEPCVCALGFLTILYFSRSSVAASQPCPRDEALGSSEGPFGGLAPTDPALPHPSFHPGIQQLPPCRPRRVSRHPTAVTEGSLAAAPERRLPERHQLLLQQLPALGHGLAAAPPPRGAEEVWAGTSPAGAQLLPAQPLPARPGSATPGPAPPGPARFSHYRPGPARLATPELPGPKGDPHPRQKQPEPPGFQRRVELLTLRFIARIIYIFALICPSQKFVFQSVSLSVPFSPAITWMPLASSVWAKVISEEICGGEICGLFCKCQVNPAPSRPQSPGGLWLAPPSAAFHGPAAGLPRKGNAASPGSASPRPRHPDPLTSVWSSRILQVLKGWSCLSETGIGT